MNDKTSSVASRAARPAAGCPICSRPTEPKYKPFCSPRCADVDLNRWLGGVYRVAVNDPETGIEDLPPDDK